MKDEEALKELAAIGEDRPLLFRPSSHDDLHRRHRHSLHHQPPSCHWDAISPMTTQPTFDRASPPAQYPTSSDFGAPLRRIRSRSLGTSLERRDFSSLLVPTLQPYDDEESLKGPLTGTPYGDSTTSEETVDSRPPDTPTFDDKQPEANPVWISILYGMINATIVLPVLMSFGSIIYRNTAFAPYMPVLVKLTMFSGMVHQLCFSTFSSLPFAVGQVQDAGLIFLSQMASKMVDYCQQHGYDDETMLATVTVGLAIATAFLGCGLLLVGHWKLAQYVQLLPISVVGGYLAFIGWFCGESGIGLMMVDNNVESKGMSSLSVLIVAQWKFVVPGILGGIVIYVSVRRLRHMAVLPMCILFLLLVFYVVLWATDTSVDEATRDGWIRETDPPPAWFHTWDYLRLNKVAWSALPQLILTELSMIFVVALSSSLDVAAIELELNRPLNYNYELKTVGLSNIVSGLTGGYTGSYIFSQSIFSLRSGITSRLAGYVLAICQFVFLILPVPILAYVPNFFFGSLLSMICIDLMYEWLWDVRTKVTPVEYFICLVTFGLIQATNVEYGILGGVLVYGVCHKIGLDVGEVKIGTDKDQEDNASDDSVDKDGLSMHMHGTSEPPTRDTATSLYGSLSNDPYTTRN